MIVLTLVAAFIVFVVAVVALSLGSLAGGRRLRGSCGGRADLCVCDPVAAESCPFRREVV